MENNLSSGRSNQQSDATVLLSDLESDRAGLVERLKKPKLFAPAFGALAAIFIPTPVLPATFNRGFILTSIVITGVLLVLGYQWVTGIKLLRFRVLEGVLFGIAILTTLLFFSVSLGLASSGHPLWIIASAIAEFLAATGLALLGASAMRERVRDVA